MRHQLLLIVDRLEVRESLAVGLRNEGYDVWTAATGLLGLRAARALLPDLVVLDVDTADMDSQVICRILRGLASTCEIPIFLLQKPANNSPFEAADYGNAACLGQSSGNEDLIAGVKDALERRNVMDQADVSAENLTALVPA